VGINLPPLRLNAPARAPVAEENRAIDQPNAPLLGAKGVLM
jgi:hypothetical protein